MAVFRASGKFANAPSCGGGRKRKCRKPEVSEVSEHIENISHNFSCAYGAMLVLGCCALAIGVLTFTDVRRAEATLIGALAAITFALPVLRNALPDSPPLGVAADMWVFVDRTRRRAGACALGFQMVESRSQPLRSAGRGDRRYHVGFG